jgi:hypothetical protein
MSLLTPAQRYVERRKEAELQQKRLEAGIRAEWRWFRHKYPHPYADELEPFFIQELQSLGVYEK